MRCLPSLVVALCLPLSAGLAATEPYGRHFLLPGATPVVALETPAAADDDETEARLRAQAEEAELQGGPYAPLLAETLGDLARLLDRRQDFDAAQALRERALHLVRVNEGLYSPAQAPLVRGILDSLRQRGDYQALDERYAYFFRLYGAGRPPFTPARWAALLEYLRWQREALLRGLDGDPRRRLLDLHATGEDVIEALLSTQPVPWEQLRDAALAQLHTLYLIEDLVQPVEVFPQTRIDRIRRDDPRDFDLLRERLENLQRTSLSRGRDVLAAAIDAVPPDRPGEQLRLRLAQADWLQWQGQSREAREAYEAIWAAGVAASLDGEVRAWFAEPVALPASDTFALPGAATSVPLEMTIDVSANGRLRIVAADADAARQRDSARLGRYLRAARFRPALEDGRVVDTSALRLRWVLVEE